FLREADLVITGKIEGESLKTLREDGDSLVYVQDMRVFPSGHWSGDSQLCGRPRKTGAWVDLELPVSMSGTYRVVVHLTKARDYGIVQFHLNGQPLGKPFDGFTPDVNNRQTVVNTGPIELGTVALPEGLATLRVEVVGANEQSDGWRYLWGIDCLELQPV